MMASVSQKNVIVYDKNVQCKNTDKFKNELAKRLGRHNNPPDFLTKLPTAPIHSSSGLEYALDNVDNSKAHSIGTGLFVKSSSESNRHVFFGSPMGNSKKGSSLKVELLTSNAPTTKSFDFNKPLSQPKSKIRHFPSALKNGIVASHQIIRTEKSRSRLSAQTVKPPPPPPPHTRSLKDAKDVLRIATVELACCICFKTPVEPTLCKDCHQIVGCGACVNYWNSKSNEGCPKCRGSSGFIGVRGLNGFGQKLREYDEQYGL